MSHTERPGRMTRAQLALGVGLVLVAMSTPLLVLRGVIELGETLSTVSLSSNTTGVIADAQRDALLTERALERLKDGEGDLPAVRDQAAYMGRQVRVLVAQDLPEDIRPLLEGTVAAHDALLEDVDALIADGAVTIEDPAVVVMLPELLQHSEELNAALSSAYGKVENVYYLALAERLAGARIAEYVTFGAAFAAVALGTALAWSLRRSVARGFEEAAEQLRTEARERELAQEQIALSERRLSALVANSNDVTLVLDSDLAVRWASPAATRLVGPELLGTELLDLVVPDERDDAHAAIEDALRVPGRTLRTFTTILLPDRAGPAGQTVPGRLAHITLGLTSLLDDPAVAGIVVNAHDVTELTQYARELERLAFHDRLTGLPNRLSLERTLDGHLRSPDGVTLLVMDLDDFRGINELRGPEAGDTVLRTVAARLAQVPGCEAFHLGGDEFVLMHAARSGPERIEERVAAIRSLVSEPVPVGGEPVRVSFAAGVAVSGSELGDPLQALRDAEVAMRAAKRAGGGALVVVDERSVEHAALRRRINERLATAVQDGLLHLVYQPIVSATDGRWRSVEALVRWTGEEGDLPPSVFIPIAEESGRIVEVGRWVLRTAMAEVLLLRRSLGAPDLSLNVNVSARQLEVDGFLDEVVDLLEETGLEPGGLVLELTEGAFLADQDRAIAVLEAARARGLRVALDDFGTGYSSLSYLVQIPADVVKIDRSFVLDVTSSARSRSLLRAVCAIAHELGLRVTVEGVETPEQLAAVTAAGTDSVQGFLTCRPMPSAALIAAHTRGAVPRPRPDQAALGVASA